jgi:hypothetical protein
MTIKQQGGIFGRNPTFNNVTIDGTLSGVSSLALSGNLVLADGQGIDFSATSGTGTSELFDDYEEGAWTPVLSSTGTAPTVDSYSSQSGRYTKIGNTVIARCSIRATLSSAGTGDPKVTGLPFANLGGYSGVTAGLQTLLQLSSATYDRTIFPQGATFGGGSTELRFYKMSYVTGSNNYLEFTVIYDT